MAADIEAALSDPELISLREQMAVLDSLAMVQLRALGEESPAQRWEGIILAVGEFQAEVDQIEAAIGPLATEEIQAKFRSMREWGERVLDFARSGSQARQAELSLREIIQEQRMVATAEVRREQALTEHVTARQLGVLVALVVASVRRHIDDPVIQRSVSADLIRALGARDRGLPGGVAE